MSLVRETVYIKELVVRVLKMLDTGVSSGPSISNFVLKNKGSLLTTDGAETPAVVSEFLSGPDNYFLIADSTQEFGLRWSESGAPVDSVNGKVGAVVLDASDINQTTQKGQIYVQDAFGNVGILNPTTDGFTLTADSSQPLGVRWGDQPPPNVLSVNAQTGVVVLNIGDVDPTTSKGQIITFATTSTVLNVGPDGTRLQADNNETSGVKWGTLDTQPVLSVNGKTGVVVLTYDEIKPTTIKGDLLVYNGFNNISLPVGTDGQILFANSVTGTGIQWGNNELLTTVRKSLNSFAARRTSNIFIAASAVANLNTFDLPATTFDDYVGNDGSGIGQFDRLTGIYRIATPGVYYLNIKFAFSIAGVNNLNSIKINIKVNNIIIQTAYPFIDDTPISVNDDTIISHYYTTYLKYKDAGQTQLLVANDQIVIELENTTGLGINIIGSATNPILYSLCLC